MTEANAGTPAHDASIRRVESEGLASERADAKSTSVSGERTVRGSTTVVATPLTRASASAAIITLEQLLDGLEFGAERRPTRWGSLAVGIVTAVSGSVLAVWMAIQAIDEMLPLAYAAAALGGLGFVILYGSIDTEIARKVLRFSRFTLADVTIWVCLVTAWVMLAVAAGTLIGFASTAQAWGDPDFDRWATNAIAVIAALALVAIGPLVAPVVGAGHRLAKTFGRSRRSLLATVVAFAALCIAAVAVMLKTSPDDWGGPAIIAAVLLALLGWLAAHRATLSRRAAQVEGSLNRAIASALEARYSAQRHREHMSALRDLEAALGPDVSRGASAWLLPDLDRGLSSFVRIWRQLESGAERPIPVVRGAETRQLLRAFRRLDPAVRSAAVLALLLALDEGLRPAPWASGASTRHSSGLQAQVRVSVQMLTTAHS